MLRLLNKDIQYKVNKDNNKDNNRLNILSVPTVKNKYKKN